MQTADVQELQRRADEAAGNYGRGLALWERGEVSAHELGVLKRRANKAQQNLRSGRYSEVS